MFQLINSDLEMTPILILFIFLGVVAGRPSDLPRMEFTKGMSVVPRAWGNSFRKVENPSRNVARIHRIDPKELDFFQNVVELICGLRGS